MLQNPAIPVYIHGIISSGNSTRTPLAGGGTFTGITELVHHPDTLVTIASDADGTLYLDFSIDGGSNFDSTLTFNVSAGVGEFHSAVKGTRMVRVRYVNGSAAQSYFRLQTEYGSFRQGTFPLNRPIQQDSDATTVRAITEELSMAAGLVTGFSIINKVGANLDIDTGTVPEDVWGGSGLYTGFPDSTLELVEVVSSSANDASAGTGARTLRITGLDTNYNDLSETITLNGTTPVDSVGQYRRVHSAQVMSAGSGGVNAGTLTVRHTTTTANVFLSITVGTNQSSCSAYTVPAGYTAYMRRVHCGILGTSQGQSPGVIDGNITTRHFGEPFRVVLPFSATTYSRLSYDIYGGFVFTEKSDIVVRVTGVGGNDTSVNAGYDLVLVRN